MHTLRAAVLLLLVVSSLSKAQSVDETRVPDAAGPAVVKAVIEQLESSCIFPDDKLFLYRLAEVESKLGQDAYVDDLYHGGIWKVRSQFELSVPFIGNT